MSNLLYNSLLNSDFLILSDSNKITNNLITKNIKLQNNNLQILDSFSILKSIKQMIKIIEILQSDSNMYDKYSKDCIKQAEAYHIENVAKLYKELEK